MVILRELKKIKIKVQNYFKFDVPHFHPCFKLYERNDSIENLYYWRDILTQTTTQTTNSERAREQEAGG